MCLAELIEGKSSCCPKLDVFAGAFAADIGDLEGAEPNQKDEEEGRLIFKFCDSGIFFEQRLLILNPLILPSSQTKASAGFGLGQAEHALSDAKVCRELKPDWPK
ncbi:hypothetical protein DY000_02005717 [Brassica cretica]|uniref:Uncharacterized protein n=1 Tax=Brassica cretica TaxID=69181 RepID=A0ABQ7C8F5_BRACR|nr:hypothetical protein DY000_02005717 [Brassica cretica]